MESFQFNNNFDLRNMNNSVLDEMNSDIFDHLPNYETFVGNPPITYLYPQSIKLIKLIVSHSNAVIPNGPFEYIITNATMGNNNIPINHSNIISAFNNSSMGYIFDINVKTIYNTRENYEIVVNNFSQYIK
jgi:hypothetical protein